MAAGIAHELNQPLSGIRIYAQMIERLNDSSQELNREKVAQTMTKIMKQVDRTSQIIQHIRQFSSDKTNETTDAEELSIQEVFESSLDLIGQQIKNHGIEIINKIDHLHLVSFNRTRLEQVFINLLTNARDAIDEKATSLRQIELRSESQDGRILLFIRDSGTGINDEVQHKLFEPFTTSKDPGIGTGLGLSICVGILRDYNATIKLYHSSSEGSTFLLSFPGNHS